MAGAVAAASKLPAVAADSVYVLVVAVADESAVAAVD